MHSETRLPLVAVAAAAICLSSVTVNAQSTSGINTGIQFDFSLPGARSLAMAGAFVAVADDATASQSNPAGLTALSRAQLSVEGRGYNFFTPIFFEGHVFGPPTGFGVDTVPGLSEREFKNGTGALSFLSFVYPKAGWAVAGYRHEFSKFKNTAQTIGPFIDLPDGRIRRSYPADGQIEIGIVNYGGSVARRVGNVSIGASLLYSRFDIQSNGSTYLVLPHEPVLARGQGSSLIGAGQMYGAADVSESNVFFREAQTGESGSFGATVGMLWNLSDQWTAAAAYRHPPVFNYDSTFTGGPAHARVGSPLSNVVIDSDQDIEFHVPRTFSAGLSYAPFPAFKLAFEYDRVQYSELNDGTGEGLPVDHQGLDRHPDADIRELGRLIQEGLVIDNVNQLRLGAEWAVSRAPAVFLRFGTWYDPNHQVHFIDKTNAKNRFTPLATIEVMIPDRPDEWHFSTGGGLTFSRFQVDGAVDLSPRVNTVSVSTVIYF